MKNTHTFCLDWIITDTIIIIGHKNFVYFPLILTNKYGAGFYFFSHQMHGSLI